MKGWVSMLPERAVAEVTLREALMGKDPVTPQLGVVCAFATPGTIWLHLDRCEDDILCHSCQVISALLGSPEAAATNHKQARAYWAVAN